MVTTNEIRNPDNHIGTKKSTYTNVMSIFLKIPFAVTRHITSRSDHLNRLTV